MSLSELLDDRTADNLVLNFFTQLNEVGAVARDADDQVAVFFRLLLGFFLADCFAGVWGYNMQKQDYMETGDLQEALNAAEAIGDDRLQQQSQGRVVPDSFTHGTSQQRYTWFKRGFDSGDPAQCNTFGNAL